jgi:predicted transcriptional regulator
MLRLNLRKSVKQISIQITDETARQMAQLARHWGLPRERHNTAVIERAIATMFMFEIGYAEYQARLKALQQGIDQPIQQTDIYT